MRILILSDGFSAPAYKPRLRALCDFLYTHGHEIEVYCEQADPLHFEHKYPINEIALYSGTKIDWAIKNCATMLFNWKERAFEKRVTQAIQGKVFDLVFCTSFYSFPLRSANNIAIKRGIPSVLDLRDMVEQAPANQRLYLRHHHALLHFFAKLYQHQNIRRRNYDLRRANAITTVSPWHVNLVRSITPCPCYLIYNGFDETIFQPKDCQSSQFKIIYTGKVFPVPQQDPSMLFEGIKATGLTPEQLSIHWFTDELSRQRIQNMAARAEVQPWMVYHKERPQNEIISLLHEASICLVLTSRAGDNNGHGKMTTKFFEGLGIEKPVLCVESDEECLAAVIRSTHAGISAVNVQEVKTFILDKYAEWQSKGYTRQQVDHQQKRLFSRQEQARQWEQLFREIIG